MSGVLGEFMDLMALVIEKKASNSDREKLNAYWLRMMMASRVEDTRFQPAQVGTDTEKLNGQYASYYLNSTNQNAGTLHTDRYSAYADLTAESKLGSGALQVAVGNHNHGGSTSGNLSHYIDGTLAVLANVAIFVAPYDGTISKVNIAIKDKGTANSTIVDVHKNGTTIFTTQASRPTIAFDDADGVASGTPDVISFVAGDIFTFHIDAAATGAGSLFIEAATSYVNTDTPEPVAYIFTVEGDLVVATGKLRIYNMTGVDKTITQVFGSVSNVPVGAEILIDVNVDGVTIFTTQSNRLAIAAGANTGTSTTIENASWPAGSYLTMDPDQVGSASSGYNLTVHVVTL